MYEKQQSMGIDNLWKPFAIEVSVSVFRQLYDILETYPHMTVSTLEVLRKCASAVRRRARLTAARLGAERTRGGDFPSLASLKHILQRYLQGGGGAWKSGVLRADGGHGSVVHLLHGSSWNCCMVSCSITIRYTLPRGAQSCSNFRARDRTKLVSLACSGPRQRRAGPCSKRSWRNC